MQGYESVMNGLSDLTADWLLLKLGATVCGRRPAGASWRGNLERRWTVLHAPWFECVRLPSGPGAFICKKTGGLLMHSVGSIRVSAIRRKLEKLVKLIQHVLWFKMGATEEIGVSASFFQ